MIKLKDILNEIEERDTSNAYSWQKPDGTFVPLKHDHGTDAHNYRFHAAKNKNDFDSSDDHIHQLWRMGWQRITFSDYLKSIYANNELMEPNEKQKGQLISLALELGSEKIEWDGGAKHKIIWP